MRRVTTEAARAAKAIRAELKRHKVAGRVTSSNYSQGSRVSVELFDPMPATLDRVKAFAGRYGYQNAGCSDSIPQARFVFVEASWSDDLADAAKQYTERHADNVGIQHAADMGLPEFVYRSVLTGRVGSFWTDRKPVVRVEV